MQDKTWELESAREVAWMKRNIYRAGFGLRPVERDGAPSPSAGERTVTARTDSRRAMVVGADLLYGWPRS